VVVGKGGGERTGDRIQAAVQHRIRGRRRRGIAQWFYGYAFDRGGHEVKSGYLMVAWELMKEGADKRITAALGGRKT